MTKQILTGVLLLAGLALFVGLGVWQLQRLEWKEGVLAEIEARIGAAPVDVPATPDPDADRYLPVAVTGTMEAGELHVLVSHVDYGAGFRIVSPFVTDTGRRIMVDRGFVPSARRDDPHATGEMQVAGNLHWPDERDSYTPEDDLDANYWYARDVDRMSAALDTEHLLLVARTETDPAILPLPVSPDGIRNKHFEYAMTWFLFAATWVGMTGFALWRIRRRTPADLESERA
ncbi:SURF1 family protein [Maritimibacter sp. DP1N21-5]|uniref:SURF1 family protein n=1 Tax=Maritimibacter sp. DP1N21-5 TaxID=2836867 RepID=UPI001C439D29|nr:SURF1 family protein [Maritimibacter sp. DP1N21-5]MBV7410623.1 SURF1 family protein [Maritimibacter sp. DP1N21-5]